MSKLYALPSLQSAHYVADFVRAKREKLNLSQPELAQRAGVGLRFIRELECSKPTLRCDKVNQVLALFGKQLGPVDMVRED